MIPSSIASAVVRMSAAGKSKRTIARALGIGRATVRRYVQDPVRGMAPAKLARPKPFKLDAGDAGKLQALIREAKGNCSIVCRRINDNPGKYGLPCGFSVSQRAVSRFATTRFPGEFAQSRVIVNMPFHCEPGQQLQIDFVKAKFIFTDASGIEEERPVYLFEAVYSWSRKCFVRVCPDMTQNSWLTSIAGCLAENGVPREILCDNDKSLVIRNRWREKIVEFNPAFKWLCDPLGIRPRAARPARPQTKGRVERFGGYLQLNGLTDVTVGRRIADEAELQVALDRWRKDVADKRIFKNGSVRATSAEFYEREKKFLQFPPNLKATLTIDCWLAEVSHNGGVYIHGQRVALPLKQAGCRVIVAIRSSGEYLVSAGDGRTLAEGHVPEENLHKFRRDEAPAVDTVAQQAPVAPQVIDEDVAALEEVFK